MQSCPGHSRIPVDNNLSEWDLPLPLSVPVLPSSSLDRNSPNVHALSSKLAKCKEDIEAWDDDQDFVSFEPIFEQLQFQQSGRLPRSPMSDASSNSATDYFQYHHPRFVFALVVIFVITFSISGDRDNNININHNDIFNNKADYLFPHIPTESAILVHIHIPNPHGDSNDRSDNNPSVTADPSPNHPHDQFQRRIPICHQLPPYRRAPSVGPLPSPDQGKAVPSRSTFQRGNGHNTDTDTVANTDTINTSLIVMALKTTSWSILLDDNTVSTTTMTTITQEMMSMATYSGVITRINPIRRVAAWVDDLDDLEMPEQDLDFNQVRTTLAKAFLPENLEATEGWDTESESESVTNEDQFAADLLPYSPLTPTSKAHYHTSLPSSLPGTPLKGYVPLTSSPDAIETLEDPFDSTKFGSFKSTLDKRQRQITSPTLSRARLSQSLSLSRQDSNAVDGRDVNHLDEPDDFWEGIEIKDDQAFHHKGRNKNLVLRPNIHGRARSGSRVQREVVLLKDFVALPSKIPRLCRAPGDTSRAISPAPALSRAHSTHFDLPLRNLKSKSSLPRLKKQPSVIKREAKSMLSLSSSDTLVSSESIGNPPSPFVSRATTPISIQLNTGHRSSWHLGKDDLPSFKSSSLALRSVSFVEGSEAQPTSAHSSLSKAGGTLPKPSPVQEEDPNPPTPSPPLPLPGRSFANLRTMVKKWDWGRNKSVPRGHIPSFLSTSTTADDAPSSSIAEETPSLMESIKTISSETKPERPSVSRSSTYSDCSPMVVDSRPPSRSATAIAVLDVQLSGLDALDGVSSTGSVAEKFPKRFFLKRSLKHNSFGDGFELDQFDNLPTYQAREEAYQVQIQEMVQGRRQSMDRVTAWLRKPQSIANLKEMAKIEEMPTEPEVPESPKLRKSKSIRRSLFDIFGPNTSESAKSKKKRKKVLAGPTLTPIHSQASVHKFSDSVPNPPQHVPWNGNEDSIDDDCVEERTEYSEDSVATDTPKFDFPAPPQPASYFPTSPLLNATVANRPALITNLGQFSKQRTQVSGKMMFDPVRMCWIFNPEYLARRRRRLGQRNNNEDDDIWGDEPDVFAGLSDDDSDRSEENYYDDGEWDHPPSRSSSLRRGPWTGRRRLLPRPSFPRYPSQEFLKEDGDAQVWEAAKAPPTIPASVDGSAGDSRPGSMGVHSVVSKSSRRSLNVQHGFCSNGISSCGEFEVGIEFDITEDFLEQCIAAEAQHRKDAGKFFALPCSPPDEKVPVANVAMAKILTLGKKSGNTSVAPPKAAREEEAEDDNAKPATLSWTGTLKSRSKSKSKSKSKSYSKATALTKEIVEDDSITHQPPPQEVGSRRSSITFGGLDSGVDFAKKQDKEGRKKNKKNASLKEKASFSLLKEAKSSLKKSQQDPEPPFTSLSSWPSSTTATAPISQSLAVRGRSGSRQKTSTLQFDEHNYYASSTREPLSFSATLAVARKGKFNSYGKRRIDARTFVPPVVTSLAVIDAGDHSSPIKGGIFRLRKIGSRRKVAVPPDDSNESEEDLDEEVFEDEYMDRGYRSMSNSRGRPPLRPRADLLFEFEKYASLRFHR
ncbi:hypothetical protein CPC16_012076 [Podila verticillata]|nr:hypothetical protein CPC16_012076 [Podila verticillata]